MPLYDRVHTCKNRTSLQRRHSICLSPKVPVVDAGHRRHASQSVPALQGEHEIVQLGLTHHLMWQAAVLAEMAQDAPARQVYLVHEPDGGARKSSLQGCLTRRR